MRAGRSIDPRTRRTTTRLLAPFRSLLSLMFYRPRQNTLTSPNLSLSQASRNGQPLSSLIPLQCFPMRCENPCLYRTNIVQGAKLSLKLSCLSIYPQPHECTVPVRSEQESLASLMVTAVYVYELK